MKDFIFSVYCITLTGTVMMLFNKCHTVFLRLLVLFGLSCLYALRAQGQQNLLKGKAQRYLQTATLYEIRNQPQKAIAYYQKSIRKDRNQTEAYQSLSGLYREQQQFSAAAETLRKCTSCPPNDQLLIADNLYRSGQYLEATKTLEALLQKNIPSDTGLQYRVSRLKTIIASARVYKNAPVWDTVIPPQNMGDRINSEYDEYFPSISLNDSVLVFTHKTNGIDQDFYLAQRDPCGGWLAAAPLSAPPNSPQQEEAQMLSADGHYLFFTRCQNQSPNGWAQGGCDLYFSYDVPGGWSQPVPFGATINTPAYEGMPSLSPDNKVLYFVSDRPGGYGGKDIWMSRFEDGLWQTPENLGANINTAGDETSPWMAADNQTLYFTSNGHPGLGGNDIYLSRKQTNGQWTRPINLGYPINTSSDDVSLTVTNDGKKAYFASNRPGGIGGMDMYETPLPVALQPQPRTFVYGIVKDSLTGERLPLAVLTWVNQQTGTPLAQYISNRGDASFISAFPLHVPLALEVSRYHYLSFTDSFYFKQAKAFPPDTVNIALLPEGYNPPLTDTTLLTVYFGKSSATLSDSALRWVKQTVSPYSTGRYHEFYVNGFTDTSGYPAINEDISLRRAVALKKVLVHLGIPADKIHARGWSDSNPAHSNQTESSRALNRRAELVLRRPL